MLASALIEQTWARVAREALSPPRTTAPWVAADDRRRLGFALHGGTLEVASAAVFFASFGAACFQGFLRSKSTSVC